MGRHRQYDVDEVLDAALHVFWRKGYEGTSYTDLTQATGVERPALYSAFGNKEALFKRALERYYDLYLAFFPAAVELATSREVAQRVLLGAIELNTRYSDRKGCLVVHGAIAGTDDSEVIRNTLIEARATGEAILRERFERARSEGDLPKSANSAVLATFICAVLHGLAIQAKAGFTRDVLEAVANHALSTWPTVEPKQ
ncbi:AcrR family transcriptional regulator [Pseudoxanthomonas japonensis]|uniref:TetR/AcrR family transcriptional regulator n=1 Tax=Pseudoxanthomonas TaxID=83618 RepID=UPI0007831626|nr:MULTISPECIES: TetR/AcrR family transcriptional regulator [Pseudoxanthomonas]MBA3927977.1 TetR/AcrR family transcriptional regulator [Xanthomonas sp.]MDR7068702.1 AcrR family transcriptional regulator [Pseudoxanthomonas japonensis]